MDDWTESYQLEVIVLVPTNCLIVQIFADFRIKPVMAYTKNMI
jgi:hypothetical protein